MTGVRRLATPAAVLLFLALWLQQSGKPLQLDDVDHYGIAKAILETGRPVYYRGEDNPAMSGALHPPLNDYLLAEWLAVWGSGVRQAKAFSLFCTFGQGIVALLLARCLLPPVLVRRLRPWFWALFLLNPYTLQLSSMVDIDAASYGPWLGLLLWSVVRLHWQDGRRKASPPRLPDFAVVSLLTTACLWTKLTTILLVIPFACLLWLPGTRLLRSLAEAAMAIGAGVGLFFLTYGPACHLWGLDPFTSVAFTRRMASSGGHLANPALTLEYMAKHLARWTGLLPWLATFAALFYLVRRAFRRPRELPALTLAIVLALATLSTGWYGATRLTFANAPYKYAFVFFAILSMPLAAAAARQLPWPSTAVARLTALGLTLAAGLGVALMLLRDTVVAEGWGRTSIALLGLPAAAGGLAAMSVLLGVPRFPRAGALLHAAVCFHLGAQTGVAVVQARAGYSTTYDYGQRGLAEAARFVHDHTDENDVISSMKDLGMLAERRYIENYAALYGGEEQTDRLLEAWESGRVRLIVFTEGIGQDQLVMRPRLASWLREKATVTASFGNYRIYRPQAE